MKVAEATIREILQLVHMEAVHRLTAFRASSLLDPKPSNKVRQYLSSLKCSSSALSPNPVIVVMLGSSASSAVLVTSPLGELQRSCSVQGL